MRPYTAKSPSSMTEIDDDMRQVLRYLKDGYEFDSTDQVFRRGEGEYVVPGSRTLLAIGECLARRLLKTDKNAVVITTLGMQVRT